MIKPTNKQIIFIKHILLKSVKNLVKYDLELFRILQNTPYKKVKTLDRKLYEVSINHRLAYYIEREIKKNILKKYHVDLEYNRYYYTVKKVLINKKQKAIRPDILVHSRRDNKIKPQHYLAIEAKKGKISIYDEKKLKGLISYHLFHYMFGLGISYCYNPNCVTGRLYYFNGKEIINEEINFE